MGWREALAVTMADEQNDNGDGTRSDVYFAPNPSHVAWVERSMRRLSAADRIALARELLAGTGRVDVGKTETADVLAWLLLVWGAQQRIISPSDRLIALTARHQERQVGDVIADAQRFRAAIMGDEG